MNCPTCNCRLEIVRADEPWHPAHLQCPKCDGTFNLESHMNCFICKGSLDEAIADIAPLKIGDRTVYAHTRHAGVSEQSRVDFPQEETDELQESA